MIMACETIKRPIVKVSTNDSLESEDDTPQNSNSEEQSLDSSEDDAERETLEGNPFWANAILNVLNSKKPKNKKNIILAKAKKDIDVRKKEEKEKVFEVVNIDGKIENFEERISVKRKRAKKAEYDQSSTTDEEEDPRDLKKRIKKKILFEQMCRVKPRPLDKDRERQLTRTATKGVVQLFNAVREHQKKLNTKLKDAGLSEVKQEKVMKSVSKGAFLDLLKGTPSQKVSSSSQEPSSRDKRKQSEETQSGSWGIFDEDLLLRARLKDWDKTEEPNT